MSAIPSSPPVFPRLDHSTTEAAADPASGTPAESKPYRSPARMTGDFDQGQSTSDPTALFFDPGEQQTADIIEAVLSPVSSLTSIAADHGTSLHAITSWLTRPDIAARIDATESVCARRLRAVAVNHLPIAVGAITHTIRACDYEESHVPAKELNHFEAKRRTRETMLRAARLLLRFASFQPGALPTRPFRPPTPTSPTSPSTQADSEPQQRKQQAQPAPHLSLHTQSIADSHEAQASSPDAGATSLPQTQDQSIPFADDAAPQPLPISTPARALPHHDPENEAPKSGFEKADRTPASPEARRPLSQSAPNASPCGP